MVFAVLFTLRGGLESVIWTDIVQVGVYMGAAVVSVVLLWRAIPADAGRVLEALRHGGADGSSKLSVLRLGLDSSKPLGIDFGVSFTLLTACTGWVLLNLAAFGTDQDLTQRMLTCRNAKEGARSVIASTLVGVPAVVIFSVIGLLLWVVCRRPDLMGAPIPEHLSGDAKGLLLRYAMHSGVWGFAGLIIAGVLAAGPAGINASLNSMAGTFIQDIYKPVIAPGRGEGHYVRAGRWAVAAWAVVLGAFAVACIWWQQHSGENIINFVLGVMGFAYAGLLATFLTGLFTKRGNTASVIGAMVVGFVVVLALQPGLWAWWTAKTEWMAAHLKPLVIASPWRLLIGTACAFAVCVIPAGTRGRAA
jgi:Na+/proline symporter